MKLSLIIEATVDQVERRIPIWVKKYFDSDQQLAHEVIPDIISADPAKGKYSEWLIRQWKDGTARFPEDTEKLEKNLSLFHKKKSKLPEKDINKYTPAELAKALEKNLGLTKSQRKKARGGSMELPPGAEYLGKVRNVEVVKIITPKASSVLCSGTQWCTANREAAEEYLEGGPLFLIFIEGEREYLLHYETASFMDVYDEEIESEELFPLLDLISGLTGHEIEEVPQLALRYANDVVGGRFPEGEPAIAKDAQTAYTYAQEVIHGRFPEGEPAIAQEAMLANFYASGVIEGRFPKGEPAIARDPQYACTYALTVLERRWPEAEPTIAKDPESAWLYAKNIIGGRWPEAEPAIAEDPGAAVTYAKDVIGGRWPEAEPAIARDPGAAVTYAKDVIGGRWPEAEPAIAEDPKAACEYAKTVIGGRWPEAEPAIAKHGTAAYVYARDVIGGPFPEGEEAIDRGMFAISYLRLMAGKD